MIILFGWLFSVHILYMVCMCVCVIWKNWYSIENYYYCNELLCYFTLEAVGFSQFNHYYQPSETQVINNINNTRIINTCVTRDDYDDWCLTATFVHYKILIEVNLLQVQANSLYWFSNYKNLKDRLLSLMIRISWFKIRYDRFSFISWSYDHETGLAQETASTYF